MKSYSKAYSFCALIIMALLLFVCSACFDNGTNNNTTEKYYINTNAVEGSSYIRFTNVSYSGTTLSCSCHVENIASLRTANEVDLEKDTHITGGGRDYWDWVKIQSATITQISSSGDFQLSFSNVTLDDNLYRFVIIFDSANSRNLLHDRTFLEFYIKDSEFCLSHLNYDVSGTNEVVKDFYIMDCVKVIADSAFYTGYHANPYNVIFGQNSQLRKIGIHTFGKCSHLTTFVMPRTVTEIRGNAFQECTALSKVYYLGTSAEWDLINIRENNESLTNATRYYYSESQPTTAGNYWHYVNGLPTEW